MREVLLVGRPNSGKSSLYNLLTGGDAKVGNFPGVTVDVLEGRAAHDGIELTLFDLPGLYTLETQDDDSDEGQARAFLERTKGALVAQVIDATHLALGLRLTRELGARQHPVLLVLTQRDVIEREGREVDLAELERATGLPAILVSARDPADRARLLARFAEAREVHARAFDPDEAAAAVMKQAPRGERFTQRADRVLLHPALGPVIFLALMTALFALVFALADPASGFIDGLVDHVAGALGPALGRGWVASLTIDGILGGAGTVLAFLPQIVVLTVALELIESSGYLARGAFLVDRVLRVAGLGGRSFVPLLTAHACAVPAIGATRIVRDPGQRLRTILVLPLMTCSARIPTYALLIQAFFGHASALAKSLLFVGLYFAGILSGLVASLVIGKTVKQAGRSLPLVLEMPSYRAPQLAVVLRTAWRACVRFVKDVGSGILVASIALWVLLTVPAPGGSAPAPPNASPRVVAMHRSVAAKVGHALEPVTQAAGFDWRINVGLIGSFGARELMVSTLGVIFGIESAADDDAPLAQQIREAKDPSGEKTYDAAAGLALLAFFVVACQCFSTVMAIRRETRTWRWPLFVLAYTYAVGFALAVVVHAIARALA